MSKPEEKQQRLCITLTCSQCGTWKWYPTGEHPAGCDNCTVVALRADITEAKQHYAHLSEQCSTARQAEREARRERDVLREHVRALNMRLEDGHAKYLRRTGTVAARLDEAEGALRGFSGIDWCIGYEFTDKNYRDMDEAQDVARAYFAKHGEGQESTGGTAQAAGSLPGDILPRGVPARPEQVLTSTPSVVSSSPDPRDELERDELRVRVRRLEADAADAWTQRNVANARAEKAERRCEGLEKALEAIRLSAADSLSVPHDRRDRAVVNALDMYTWADRALLAAKEPEQAKGCTHGKIIDLCGEHCPDCEPCSDFERDPPDAGGGEGKFIPPHREHLNCCNPDCGGMWGTNCACCHGVEVGTGRAREAK